jgi:hypothetical protein
MKTDERKSYAGGGAAWPLIVLITGVLSCALGAAVYAVVCHFARLAVLP